MKEQTQEEQYQIVKFKFRNFRCHYQQELWRSEHRFSWLSTALPILPEIFVWYRFLDRTIYIWKYAFSNSPFTFRLSGLCPYFVNFKVVHLALNWWDSCEILIDILYTGTYRYIHIIYVYTFSHDTIDEPRIQGTNFIRTLREIYTRVTYKVNKLIITEHFKTSHFNNWWIIFSLHQLR